MSLLNEKLTPHLFSLQLDNNNDNNKKDNNIRNLFEYDPENDIIKKCSANDDDVNIENESSTTKSNKPGWFGKGRKRK